MEFKLGAFYPAVPVQPATVRFDAHARDFVFVPGVLLYTGALFAKPLGFFNKIFLLFCFRFTQSSAKL